MGPDLLSRFLDTKEDDGEVMSDKELRDVVMNFMIAGRDTTACALSEKAAGWLGSALDDDDAMGGALMGILRVCVGRATSLAGPRSCACACFLGS